MKYRLVLRQTYVGCAYWEANWRRRTPRILRRYTLFIYAKPGSINYTSSCTLIVSGRRAWIDTLNGRDFYPLIAEIGLAPFATLGIRSVEVDVKESHLRRIVQSLGHLIDVRRLRSIQLMDLRLNRIEIRARRETQAMAVPKRGRADPAQHHPIPKTTDAPARLPGRDESGRLRTFLRFHEARFGAGAVHYGD